MVTEKQKKAARSNIKKAHKAWKSMSSRERSRAQPEGRARAKPGSKQGGDFYHIEVRPKSRFKTFRTHDVGEPGGIERVAGKRSSGTWSTQKWLISKDEAHVVDGRLVPDSEDAKKLLKQLGSQSEHVEGDRFSANPRPDVSEEDKPTPAQKRARRRNFAKVQQS